MCLASAAVLFSWFVSGWGGGGGGGGGRQIASQQVAIQGG